MDIRLIRKFENGICLPIEEDLILQEMNDNYQLNSFPGKKLYIVDVENNTRQEILPGEKKYNIVSIINAECNKDYVYFTTASRMNEEIISISLIRYGILDNSKKIVFTFEDNLVELETTKNVKLFILDNNYIFFQREIQQDSHKPLPIERINNDYVNTYNGILEIENSLYSVQDEHSIEILDETISKYGIDKILQIEGNICAIKIGYSVLEQGQFAFENRDKLPTEIIGVINIKQFISELVLKKEQVFIDALDQGTGNRTFPYMNFREGNIVFSRVDIANHKEEVVIYEYLTKVTKVRVNNNLVKISDLWHTYIINDTPYLLSETKEGTDLINLNTQKSEWQLGSEDKIKFIKNDIIIIERQIKKGIARKENNYIVAYKFPDIQKVIFTEKAKFVGCLITEEDNLLIFSN